MEFIAVLLNLIVFSLNSIQAQIFLIPKLPEIIPSKNSYECRCNYINNDYNPICGSNGFTYPNLSRFYCDKHCKNSDLTLLYIGSCRTDEKISRSFVNNNLSQTKGKLKIVNQCPCSIDSEHNPVCGSNGITYKNLANLLCEKRCKEPKLHVVKYGSCRKEEYFNDVSPFLTNAMIKCNCVYTKEYDPICGTDGYTYPNLSAMSCVTECNNPSLQVVNYGPCNSNQNPHNVGALECRCQSSSEIYRPICANNGITYDNIELFSCAKKCLNRSLRIAYKHPCRDFLDIDDRKL